MHTLILGITKSGKTYFAKRLAELSKRRGRRVIVLDVLGDSWPCDYQTRDAAEFQRILQANYNCDAYADESGLSIGRGKSAQNVGWLATQSRHWGHKLHFIVQHYSFLDLMIRSQCDEHVIFRCSQKSAEAIAEEIGQPLAATAPQLEQYCCYYFKPFAAPLKMRLQGQKVRILKRY